MSIFYLLQISSAAINARINVPEIGYHFLPVLHFIKIDAGVSIRWGYLSFLMKWTRNIFYIDAVNIVRSSRITGIDILWYAKIPSNIWKDNKIMWLLSLMKCHSRTVTQLLTWSIRKWNVKLIHYTSISCCPGLPEDGQDS